MANKQWQGTTGGGNFGHNSLVFLFRIFNVKIGYVFLALVVPFYMLFAHQGYKSIYHYFRKRQHFSVYKSFIHTYRNHFLFGQMMLDRFAVYAGKSAIFTTELDGNELFEQTVNNKFQQVINYMTTTTLRMICCIKLTNMQTNIHPKPKNVFRYTKTKY
jgi:predicted LPLAT superfamily acyltransferase